MGRILKQYPRDSFCLADKFPGYDLANMDKVEEIFDQQLEKCQVDYFDFYLFHNVCEMNIDAYLDPKFHIYDSLMARKKAGQIKHLGFSAHGDLTTMRRFLRPTARTWSSARFSSTGWTGTFRTPGARWSCWTAGVSPYG